MHKHTVPSWGQSSLWTSSGGVRLRGWMCVYLCVGSTLVHLLSLSPGLGAIRETSYATLLSVTQAAISLPFLFASWYALSPALGILFMPLKEKEESLSSAPERLQQATAPPTGEPRTQTHWDLTCTQLCTHNILYTVFKENTWPLHFYFIIKWI